MKFTMTDKISLLILRLNADIKAYENLDRHINSLKLSGSQLRMNNLHFMTASMIFTMKSNREYMYSIQETADGNSEISPLEFLIMNYILLYDKFINLMISAHIRIL